MCTTSLHTKQFSISTRRMYAFYLLSHINPDRSTPDISGTHSAAFPETRPTHFNILYIVTYCVTVLSCSHTSMRLVFTAVILQRSTVIFPCLALHSLAESNLCRTAYFSACISLSSCMHLMGVTEENANLSIDISFMRIIRS
jgi:hypothetical protein